MHTEEIKIHKGEWLTNALERQGYKNIPSNVILDKTLTGLGATYTEIHSDRNSIILEPNVPVIIRLTLALAVTFVMASTLEPVKDIDLFTVKGFVLVGYQLLIGLLIGFLTN